ncbi:MAG: lactate utilization protein [Desulfovibrio sp.]|uniref:lactate utilization protein n=1 Tax=Desulfovibrio sp. 7SRBS1 TaxID=3378064 RepID=UPI003B3BF128
MSKPIDQFWSIRLQQVAEALEKNNFAVHLAETADEAKNLVLDTIIPQVQAKSVSFGGSSTVVDSGLFDALKERDDLDVLDTYTRGGSTEEFLERRRQALLTDLFITGTNALTESGQLVNLDGTGNRVAALAYGPRHCVILVGRNKIVAGLEEAIDRVKMFAAPVNAMRLNRKTPCVKTGYCMDCSSPDRICSMWSIHEKSSPKQRIHVVLINQDLGF